MALINRSRDSGRRSSVTPKVPLTYYRSAKQPESRSPFEKKSLPGRRFLAKFLDIMLIILIIVAVFFGLLLSPNPRVLTNSSIYHSKAEYKSAATAELNKIKNRNKLTIDDRAIVAGMKKQFPEISDASIEAPLFSQIPTVRLLIAQPSFFLNTNNSKYVIDSQGVAVAKASALTGINNLPLVIDQSGFNTTGGRQVLTASEVNFINSLLVQLKWAKIPLQSLTLPPLAQEIDLRTTDHSYYIKFYLSGDALTQAGQFLAARHQFDKSGNQPTQYLDVRVPGKIFYK